MMTKTSFLINLNEISDLQEFINDISYHIRSDVDAIYEKQVVDAKSILGLMSLAIHPVTVKIHSDDLSEIAYFRSVCERYEVKNVSR